jgi:serine/threonine protein kinase
MPLAAGARLGPYEIVGFIGAGGMGEVYKGHDTRLKRDVAIKTLPEIFGRDPERLSRFQREAELLARVLNQSLGYKVPNGEGEAVECREDDSDDV